MAAVKIYKVKNASGYPPSRIVAGNGSQQAPASWVSNMGRIPNGIIVRGVPHTVYVKNLHSGAVFHNTFIKLTYIAQAGLQNIELPDGVKITDLYIPLAVLEQVSSFSADGEVEDDDNTDDSSESNATGSEQKQPEESLAHEGGMLLLKGIGMFVLISGVIAIGLTVLIAKMDSKKI